MKELWAEVQSLRKYGYKNEIFAGLTSAMTMIPESLSFAILAGLSPLMGLYAAFLMGIVTAFFGGRPGMIAGGAGATIVVMMALISTEGIQYLLAAVILAGIIQFLVGVFKLGKFVRLIPQPVMYGFLNGLAVIIFMAQVKQFSVVVDGQTQWLSGMPLFIMGGLTLLTIGIVLGLPKITKAVPSSLVAILVLTAVVFFLQIDTKRVADIASVSGSLPQFHLPSVPFTLDTLKIILPYSVVMAAVGLIESLLTLNMVDEITYTKGDTNKEARAQGYANVINGFFGGMGGCAMVAQTLVNLNSGGRTRISAILSAVTILLVILVGAPVIEQIPMAALVGVMMIVAITTFKWFSFKLITKMPKADVIVGITVAAITIILHNLALAVFVGVIISALVFAWDNAKRIRARVSIDENGAKVYAIYGPLFFGSTTTFSEKFNPLEDPEEVIIDFKESRIADMSAIEAVNKLTKIYASHHKKVILRHLSYDCYHLLDNAKDMVEVNIAKDPTYKVMGD